MVGGNLTLEANYVADKNDAKAQAAAGTGGILGGIQQSIFGSGLSLMTSAFNKLFSSTSSLSQANKNTQVQGQVAKLRLAASLNLAFFYNDVEARIGSNATSDVTGDLKIHAKSEEFPEVSAISAVNSSAKFTQHKTGVAAAIAGAFVQNDAKAYIGADANVTVVGDVLIEAEAVIPYEIQYIVNQELSLTTITEKINANLGIQNGFFTSWAEATSAANEKAYGASINIFVFESEAKAFVNDGATLDATGDVTIHAFTENDTINFVGSTLFFFNATAGTGIGGAVMLVIHVNDTEARIDPGATVNGSSVFLYAELDARNIGIGVQGSLSDGYGFNLALTWLHTDNRTTAKIAESATVTTGSSTIRIAKDEDIITGSAESLFTSVPQFVPSEVYDTNEADEELTRLDADSDTLYLPFDHGFSTGLAVYYDSLGGTEINGLTSGTVYFAIVLDDATIQLAETYVDATNGTYLEIALPDTIDSGHSVYPGFDPTSSGVVDTSDEEIDLGYDHNLISGQPLHYDFASGSAIGGLTQGDTYYAIVTGTSTVKLATSEDDATDSSPTSINLTSTGSGTGHVLRPEYYGELTVTDTISALDTNGNGKVDAGDEHILSSDDDYYYTDLSFLVVAEDSSNIYSGTGSITKSNYTAVGIAVAVDVISRETKALVGDEEYYFSSDFEPGLGINAAGEVYLGYDHGFVSGDQLVYTSGGDYAVEGLSDRGIYYVQSVATDGSFTLGRSSSEQYSELFRGDHPEQAAEDRGQCHPHRTQSRGQQQACNHKHHCILRGDLRGRCVRHEHLQHLHRLAGQGSWNHHLLLR